MSRKQDAPASGANGSEGVDVVFPTDFDGPITTAARAQFLARCGIPSHRASLIAGLAFGEPRYG